MKILDTIIDILIDIATITCLIFCISIVSIPIVWIGMMGIAFVAHCVALLIH